MEMDLFVLKDGALAISVPNSRTGPSKIWTSPYIVRPNAGLVHGRTSPGPVRLIVQTLGAEYWARCLQFLRDGACSVAGGRLGAFDGAAWFSCRLEDIAAVALT